MRLFRIFGISALAAAGGCSEAGSAAGTAAEAATGAQGATALVAIRKGPTFDQGTPGFRVREAENAFVWIAGDEFELRLDARFNEGDSQRTADSLRRNNTLLRFRDATSGAQIRCGAAGDVKGDFERTLLTPERIDAMFRLELDDCSVDDTPQPERIVTVSGSVSLPRTD